MKKMWLVIVGLVCLISLAIYTNPTVKKHGLVVMQSDKKKINDAINFMSLNSFQNELINIFEQEYDASQRLSYSNYYIFSTTKDHTKKNISIGAFGSALVLNSFYAENANIIAANCALILAYRRFNQGDFLDALKLVGPATAYNKNDFNPFSLRSLCYVKLARYKDAYEDIQKALELGELPEFYEQRANIHLIEHSGYFNRSKALLDVNKAIIIAEDEYNRSGYRRDCLKSCYYTRARIYDALGNNLQACSDLKQAISLGYDAQNLLPFYCF